MTPARWLVAQIGAREHYAVARGLQRVGLLDELVTDAWCYAGADLLARLPEPLSRLSGRRSVEIPASRVRSFNLWAMATALRGSGRSGRHLDYVRVGREFALRTVRALRRRELRDDMVFFGYDTGSLECLEWLQGRGPFCVVDQIDPGPEGDAVAEEERHAHPGWEIAPEAVPKEYHDRRAAEWAAARLVVVNSDWTRDSLVRQGVPARKIAVVPCAYEGPPVQERPDAIRPGPLRVLWVGNVTLRKGVAYLVEAARLLQRHTVEVRVVGRLEIAGEILGGVPDHVSFVGAVPRDRVHAAYDWADLFVFPTLSDGFGITQLEAMSHGLPVIATPNCGRVVTHEVDGLIVPARDASALAAAIARAEADRGLLRHMAGNATLTSRRFSIAATTKALVDAVASAVETETASA